MQNKFLAALLLAGASLLPLHVAAQGAASGAVMNATFTSNVVDAQPVDFRDQFLNSTAVVYYYSELTGLAGQTVTHRWILEGKLMQEVPIKVTSARQAAWSRNTMQPQWTGNWIVKVLNGRGEVIDERNFTYSSQ